MSITNSGLQKSVFVPAGAFGLRFRCRASSGWITGETVAYEVDHREVKYGFGTGEWVFSG
jgi:hypothetical protein